MPFRCNDGRSSGAFYDIDGESVRSIGTASCGAPLGLTTGEIPDAAITASSSSHAAHHHFNVRLNTQNSWCAKRDDSEKFIEIDLDHYNSTINGAAVTVVAVGLQGFSGGNESAYVTSFSLLFANDTGNWISEAAPTHRATSNGAHVFHCNQCKKKQFRTNEVIVYNLVSPVTARYVRLNVLDYKNAPCVRLELFGCRAKRNCSHTLSADHGTLSSPAYPNYYGQNISCSWRIEPPLQNTSVELDFLLVDLTPKSKPGKCKDALTIYHPHATRIEAAANSTGAKMYPKKIISDGPVRLELKSCFRDSLSRNNGFLAKYKLVDCPGCGVGDATCSMLHTCQSTCGHILSINYPLNYVNNHRCRWLIKVPPEHYVNVTINEFDVPSSESGINARPRGAGDCMFDHLTFIDGSSNNLIGRFCNSNRPPKYIVSSYNQLLIEFYADSNFTGRGFSLSYKAYKFELPNALHPKLIAPRNACPKQWNFYKGHCYRAFSERESLQWYEAEARCASAGKGRDGHLVSILDENEMFVVHHLLVNVWKAIPYSAMYIGLVDKDKEGVYRWSDNNPMSYTDWAPGERKRDL